MRVKNLLSLAAIVTIFSLSLYLILNSNSDSSTGVLPFITKNSQEIPHITTSEGDPPLPKNPIVLGGTVSNPNNDDLSISGIQAGYIQYMHDKISFDQLIAAEYEYLAKVLNVPFDPKANYLFSVGYDSNSRTQFYFQGSKDGKKTVIFKVVYGEKTNVVTKIYQGAYLKLVTVSESNNNILKAYDIYSNESDIEVGP